jgi:hypothetical protein
MVAILCASMSTATGAILATSTVLAHNIWRKVPKIGSSEKNMLVSKEAWGPKQLSSWGGLFGAAAIQGKPGWAEPATARGLYLPILHL